MSMSAANEQVFLAEIPPVTRANAKFAAERLLLAAAEACTIAESLSLLSDTSDRRNDASETVVVSEQIARTIAWLNEAQGALLFG
jgi:hypothetical protein